MNSLLTVEDYNSAVYNFNEPFIHMVDLSLIPAHNVAYNYDFVEITIRTNTINLTVCNRVFTGNIYLFDNDGALIGDATGLQSTVTYNSEEDRVYTFEIPSSNVAKIGLLMSNFTEQASVVTSGNLLAYKVSLENNVFFMLNERTYSFIIEKASDRSNLRTNDFVLQMDDVLGNSIFLTNPIITNLETDKVKADFTYTPDEILKEKMVLSITDNVAITTNEFFFKQVDMRKSNYIKFEPATLLNGRENEVNIIPLYPVEEMVLSYLDNEVEVSDIAEQGQSVIIDLTSKEDLKKLKLKAHIKMSDTNNDETKTYNIMTDYPIITGGANIYPDGVVSKILKMENDISFNQKQTITEDIIIYGNDCTIDFDGYNILVKENVKVKIYDANFINADCCFVQEKNSRLELYNCSFTDCTSNNHNGLGSCIHCLVDIDNLNESEDFETIIKDTSFNNCTGAILSGGLLTVEGCTYVLNDAETINPNSPLFLYQTDGKAIIRKNIFDVNVDSDYLCNNQINAKIGQCLFVIGEEAILNNATNEDVQKNEGLAFFDAPYYNQSHIFIKYYYPSINDCVYVSPVLNRETKSLCYAVSGIDWIFKYNVQITRAIWESENRINPLAEEEE